MTHPLTNKKLFKKFWDYTVDADLIGEVFYTQDGMRAAYDRGRDHQLKQVQKELKYFLEDFSCRGHSADAVLDLRAFVNNFQSIMRPTSQEDN